MITHITLDNVDLRIEWSEDEAGIDIDFVFADDSDIDISMLLANRTLDVIEEMVRDDIKEALDAAAEFEIMDRL